MLIAACTVNFGAAALPEFESLPSGDTNTAFRTSNVVAGVVVAFDAQSVCDACTV